MDLRLPPEFEHLVPKKCETPGRAPRRIRYARADGEAEGAPPVHASAEGAPDDARLPQQRFVYLQLCDLMTLTLTAQPNPHPPPSPSPLTAHRSPLTFHPHPHPNPNPNPNPNQVRPQERRRALPLPSNPTLSP